MWYVIGLIWIAVMVGIIMTYNRKQRQRTGERAQHMEKMLAELKANPRAAIDAAATVAAPAATAAVPQFSRKPRLLPQATALLYYVFRAGLPDHEIFAGVALGDVVDVGGKAQPGQREQVLRKLAQQRLDLVVCTKQLEVVAAVVVSAPTAGAPAGDAQFASECLQAAGVRVVRVDPAAPPRYHQIHALVYG